MKVKYLSLLILPLLISGCSNQEESHQYQAINDQQAIMKEYYRQHTSNQSYLNLYSYSYSLNYEPTYDVFGSLAEDPTAIGLYYEAKVTSDVGVYSGYFIRNNVASIYTGNKNNVGSIEQEAQLDGFWFRAFDDDEHEGQVELIHRLEKKDNDLDSDVKDIKSGTAVDVDDVSNYFSNKVNTDYTDYFIKSLEQPTSSTTRQVSAYKKADDEIIETYKESTDLTPIENPIHPGEEHRLAVIKQTVGKTTFKYLDKIGWAGTEFEESVTYSLVTDYELNLLQEPRNIKVEQTRVTFTYASSMQPYSGEAFVYQSEDEKIAQYQPNMYTYNDGVFSQLDVSSKNVSVEYKKLHPEFSGYAYRFDNIVIEEGKLYSFASHQDATAESPSYETIGYNQLSVDAGGMIVSGGVEGHNLIKALHGSTTCEFIILFSATGTTSLIAHLTK